MTTEIRCAVELRAEDGSPGRLFGVLLNYGERAGGGRSEVFEPGALSWPAGGIVLKRQHERSAPIMRLVPELRGDQVVVDAPLPDSVAGRDAAAEIRSGLMTGLSVEFNAQRQRYVAGVRHVLAAALSGAGLVHNPEYHGFGRRGPRADASAEVRTVIWPWSKPAVEVRASAYTDQVVRALFSAAAGTSAATAAETGALEIAAGWWSSRSLASAAPSAAADAVTPEYLGAVGRELCRRGDVVHAIDVDPLTGAVALVPVGEWDIQGGPLPSSWQYTCTLSGPSTMITRRIPAARRGSHSDGGRPSAAMVWPGPAAVRGADRAADGRHRTPHGRGVRHYRWSSHPAAGEAQSLKWTLTTTSSPRSRAGSPS